jgi:hypothetical protein
MPSFGRTFHRTPCSDPSAGPWAGFTDPGAGVGLHAVGDPEILQWAADEGRILISHDLKTIPGFAGERLIAGLPMPHVILLRSTVSIAQAIDDIAAIVGASDAEEWINQIAYLPLRCEERKKSVGVLAEKRLADRGERPALVVGARRRQDAGRMAVPPIQTQPSRTPERLFGDRPYHRANDRPNTRRCGAGHRPRYSRNGHEQTRDTPRLRGRVATHHDTDVECRPRSGQVSPSSSEIRRPMEATFSE